MDFGGDNGCGRRLTDPGCDSYADDNRYTDGYRHSYRCTHPNTFTDPDGHSYCHGYIGTHNCTNADTNSYFYAGTNNDAYANGNCDGSGCCIRFKI